ncbi:MAG: response regulator [Chloroflexi bacterium]|nr:MAG: response regulator [Chloroflexota bacterium]
MTGPRRVLIVEDNEEWREQILREPLEEEGHLITTARSYQEAIAALEAHPFDLAVVDINLTDVRGNRDGEKVLQYIAQSGRTIPTIVVSGSRQVTPDSVQRFRPFAFLDKSRFDLLEYITILHRALY